MQLLISNPTRRRRKSKPRRGKRNTSKASKRRARSTATKTRPKRKPRRRRKAAATRSFSPVARKPRKRSRGKTRRNPRRSSRRRSSSSYRGSRRGFLALPAKFVPPNGIEHTLATAGGFLTANIAVERLGAQFPQIAAGWPRILAKAGISLVGYALLRKFAGQGYAAAYGIGGLTTAVLDVYNRVINAGGVGFIGQPGGVLYDVNTTPLLEGMGSMDDDELIVIADDEEAILYND